eukprot:TRINITY_DN4435_c0_g1_i3.p2 TRINITY_DN4435_c0_g1~~TRINITY_DN4435_c0_g1_i3.p2  ORF type:complete len:102 (-),score=2.49 TRINITY_DN4435_c0_g1_i3:101-406(-)
MAILLVNFVSERIVQMREKIRIEHMQIFLSGYPKKKEKFEILLKFESSIKKWQYNKREIFFIQLRNQTYKNTLQIHVLYFPYFILCYNLLSEQLNRTKLVG